MESGTKIKRLLTVQKKKSESQLNPTDENFIDKTVETKEKNL